MDTATGTGTKTKTHTGTCVIGTRLWLVPLDVCCPNLWSKPLSHHISILSPSWQRWRCCRGAYFSVLHSVFRFHVQGEHGQAKPPHHCPSIQPSDSIMSTPSRSISKRNVQCGGGRFALVASQPLATPRRSYSKNAGRDQLRAHCGHLACAQFDARCAHC